MITVSVILPFMGLFETRITRPYGTGGCDAADAYVGAVIVVSLLPLCGVILYLLNAVKDIYPEPFIAQFAILV